MCVWWFEWFRWVHNNGKDISLSRVSFGQPKYHAMMMNLVCNLSCLSLWTGGEDIMVWRSACWLLLRKAQKAIHLLLTTPWHQTIISLLLLRFPHKSNYSCLFFLSLSKFKICFALIFCNKVGIALFLSYPMTCGMLLLNIYNIWEGK